ncbi:GAF domain-containing protein [Rubrobacter marinus]|uniref:GAF domain-containing protein n=1 Tax=Rubrobacter marinus TaxID=2653852 RepID=UPI001A9F5D27|nr:GAF domain-containing protein [Rubrobacter marinus]
MESVLASAKEALDMDIAIVTEFVDGRLVFRAVSGDASSFGFEEGESIPLEHSYCKRVMEGSLPGVIADAANQEIVRDLEMTREAAIGAYAGFPLVLSDGRPYGTLCCLSHSSDPWLAERDLELMAKLAQELVRRLEDEE